MAFVSMQMVFQPVVSVIDAPSERNRLEHRPTESTQTSFDRKKRCLNWRSVQTNDRWGDVECEIDKERIFDREGTVTSHKYNRLKTETIPL
ncbi:hypothetical protein SAMN04487967_3408 [Natronorubrum sediminis]|uniref:Uncharacterized protein n=1 Tax=Natronorubrum sediminis TaxID=640943 RepID=A0A1H6G424_9EURY|nr:hypothetical protein SAMN04487967_3408 [Natronorubrum sediminis]